MKNSIIFLCAVILLSEITVDAQGLLKKVQKSMTDELLGKSSSTNNKPSDQPEPASACKDAELIFDLGGKQQLVYSELNIKVKDDGSVLVKDLVSGKIYISKGGVATGPIPEGDPRLEGFGPDEEERIETKDFPVIYKDYITRTGDKYTIKFAGKTYGPYAQINSFVVTRSKDKFAAVAVETIVVTADQGKAMDEAMKKAKTDEERMELAMKYSAEMQQKIMQGGSPNSMMAKLITNIPGATMDPNLGGNLNGNMKYDDILVTMQSDIQDLQGNKIHTVTADEGGADFFISADNKRYAWHSYGTLNFNDKTTLLELFNPHLVKADGKIYLAYMYFSPKKNSIMQCKVPF